MAHISGLIDIPDDEPSILVLSATGSLLLQLDSSTGLRFRTEAAFDAWLEHIDRLRAPGREAYHAKFQALRSVKDPA